MDAAVDAARRLIGQTQKIEEKKRKRKKKRGSEL
jgi:hypothetical protein